MLVDVALDLDDWVLCRSQSQGRSYWFHTRTGYRFWALPSHLTEMPLRTGAVSPDTHTPSTDKIAVIVPFRDSHLEQRRTVHLAKFVEEMTTFLKHAQMPFKLFIVEQSMDHRKFNRGKLLNVGFVLAESEGYSVFVLHDVDLLPSLDLLPFYSRRPRDAVVHIAKIWNRYNRNEDYFGGIASFSKTQFEALNGYPNNFWGWGGEDDELRKRLKAVQCPSIAPHSGQIDDMEEMNLVEKLTFLQSNQDKKCMNKNELLGEHEATWRSNGLTSFRERDEFLVQDCVYLNDFCVKITVELLLNNGHWTDATCGESDSQIPPSNAANAT